MNDCYFNTENFLNIYRYTHISELNVLKHFIKNDKSQILSCCKYFSRSKIQDDV